MFSSVIDVTAANDQCLNGQNGQNVFNGYPGMAIGQRIVSFVNFSAFQRETKVLTDNVYLTSKEKSIRIPLHHSLLFV